MPRRPSPSLTDAEARVMTVLWEKKRATGADVVAGLHRRAVNYSTIQTLLRILETKGYVTHEKAGRAFVFRPVIDQKLDHEVGQVDWRPQVRKVLDELALLDNH